MLNKTSIKILKSLVSKGKFQDIYDGVNIIIALIPYPDILHSYLEKHMEVLDTRTLSDSTSLPNKEVIEQNFISRPEVELPQTKMASTLQSESARQAILDLEI